MLVQRQSLKNIHDFLLATEISGFVNVGFCGPTLSIVKPHANAFFSGTRQTRLDDLEAYFLKSAIQFTMTLIC
jgi:hypothetical protein